MGNVKQNGRGKIRLAVNDYDISKIEAASTVHEMARDEARHGRAFQGLLERYFGK